MKKLRFTGNFGDVFWMNVLCAILAILTLGIMGLYGFYWNLKYIINHIEIIDGSSPVTTHPAPVADPSP